MAWNDNKFYVYATQYGYESHCYTLGLDQSSKYEVTVIAHDIQDDQDDDEDEDDEEDKDDEGIEVEERRRSVSDSEENDESETESSGDSASSMASDDKNSTQISSATPPDDQGKRAAHHDGPMHVTAITPSGGHIQGTRRPDHWSVQLNGSGRYLLVYAARFAGSLGPDYTTSWVRDASNNILGHIISVGFFKGSEIALILPAAEVFEHACNKSNPPKETDQEIVERPECVSKDVEVENDGQAEKESL
ncbi:hypothetical protein TGAMA5MH_09162 [Trichoderma gamsii]|uniref:Uncharacterized protein n=1 Tax=Trichoderma gamsii TaxID=398673 RepID=A0A2K0T079_9HYPO|nr:hypothetical protein TGAMA5MH_09162 [Trichoderma gamsii]